MQKSKNGPDPKVSGGVLVKTSRVAGVAFFPSLESLCQKSIINDY